jgi:hypothetical protein
MTPLRFRAWHKDDKRMFGVEMLVTYGDQDRFKLKEDGEAFPYESDVSHFFPSQCVVMQSIGRRDENGVEIFEDDICEWTDSRKMMLEDAEEPNVRVGVIQWQPLSGMEPAFFIVSGDLMVIPMNAYDELKVIGNRFQNPELLTSMAA